MSTDPKEHMPYEWVIQSFAEAEAASASFFQPKRGQVLALSQTKNLFDQLTLKERSHFPIENAGELRKKQSYQPPATDAPLALFWSPTPLSLACAKSIGLRLTPLPDFSILRRVLSKRFALEAGLETPPHSAIAETLNEVASAQAALGKSLRIKKEYGHAGRGQRVMKDAFTADDQRFIVAGLKSGAFILEQNLEVDELYSIHAMLLQSGELICGGLCQHEVDEYDAPTATMRLERLPHDQIVTKAFTHLKSAGNALCRAGYFGPFGLDLVLKNSNLYLIDLNARFTLGWSTGMGARRADALKHYLEF